MNRISINRAGWLAAGLVAAAALGTRRRVGDDPGRAGRHPRRATDHRPPA